MCLNKFSQLCEQGLQIIRLIEGWWLYLIPIDISLSDSSMTETIYWEEVFRKNNRGYPKLKSIQSLPLKQVKKIFPRVRETHAAYALMILRPIKISNNLNANIFIIKPALTTGYIDLDNVPCASMKFKFLKAPWIKKDKLTTSFQMMKILILISISEYIHISFTIK